MYNAVTKLAPFSVSTDAETALTVREIALDAVNGAYWDETLSAWGAASGLSLFRLKCLNIKNRLRRTTRLFGVASGTQTVGYFLVATKKGVSSFTEGLVLHPAFAGRWNEAMTAALRHLGTGAYTFGSRWIGSASKATDMASVAGVSNLHADEHYVDVVEFSDWSSWDAYYKAISANAKTNEKKARRAFPELTIENATGAAIAPAALALGMLRWKTLARKGVALDVWGKIAFPTLKTAVNGLGKTVVSARAKTGVLAAMEIARFGGVTEYRSGGSTEASCGASWALTIDVLRDAYDRSPTGRFVMGWRGVDENAAPGLVRSRRSVRSTAYRSAILTFDYRRPSLDAFGDVWSNAGRKRRFTVVF